MAVLANLCLVVATLLTLAIGLMVAEARPVSGPDAMGLFVVFVLEGLRWLAVTGALVVATRQGRLAWLHPNRTVQTVAGLVWLTLVCFTAFMAVIFAYGPDSATYQRWAIVLALVVPAIVLAALAAQLNAAAPPGTSSHWRLGAAAVSVVVATGAAAMWIDTRADAQAQQAAYDRASDEHAQRLTAQREQLAALGPDAPLAAWLPWVDSQEPELREKALAAVRNRPALAADVAAMLRGPEAPLALRFLWLWMPGPPPELAAPVHEAIAVLPAWAERRLTLPPPAAPDPVDLDDMAQAAIVLADAFGASGLDFVTPIRAFHAALQRHALPDNQYAEDPTYQARSFLDTWLQRRD